MESRISSKITHEKFRFHISTLEVESDTVNIGANNYNAFVVVYYNSTATDINHSNKQITDLFAEICEGLHHYVIIPAENNLLTIQLALGQLTVECAIENLEYSFPERAVKLIASCNTTIDDICMYTGKLLIKNIKEKTNIQESISKIKLKIFQNIGNKISVMKFKLS